MIMIMIMRRRATGDRMQALDWQALEYRSPLLAHLPLSARLVVRAVHVSPPRKLFNVGDRPAGMYFVMAGEVRLCRTSASGQQIVLQRSRGGFFAEASLDQPRYHCDAIAVAPSELLLIPRRAFNDALADGLFRRQWIAHLGRELRRVRAQAERLSLNTTAERIIHFIETEGDGRGIVLAGSRKDWASELGVTHEALYRTLTKMERGGVIVVDDTAIRLR